MEDGFERGFSSSPGFSIWQLGDCARDCSEKRGGGASRDERSAAVARGLCENAHLSTTSARPGRAANIVIGVVSWSRLETGAKFR